MLFLAFAGGAILVAIVFTLLFCALQVAGDCDPDNRS